MSAGEDLRGAVGELHAALDAWHAAVEGVAAESDGDPAHALADPRLEAAQDTFYERLGKFEALTLPVLGLVRLDGSDDLDEDDVAEDDFFVHLVVAVPDGDDPQRLAGALDVVDDAGTELGDRLRSRGFLVRHVSTSRGELELGDADDEDGPA